ncbi:MAG: phosphatase PAP2 family protein [Clostridia bacterium]|nr:phosphatase PAP2 family protein [Clostridia bacterium]
MAITEYMATTMRSPFMDVAMSLITLLGEIGIFWIIIAIVMLCLKSTRKNGFIVGMALILCLVFCNILLKNIVARPRPDMAFWSDAIIFRPGGFSFPSGHTTSSFAAAGALFYWNKKVGAAAIVTAALIGFSRIYLGVHYFSDVVSGAVLGLILSVVAVVIVERLFKTTKQAKDN